MSTLFAILFILAIVMLVASIIRPGTNKKTGKPFKRKDLAIGFGVAALVLAILTGVTAPSKPTKTTADLTSQPKQTNTVKTSSAKPAQPSTTTTSQPPKQTTVAATPPAQATPSHTIVYQFSLMSGSMNSTDQQNVGISWKDPTTGKNQIPTDIAGAIQQINAGSYTVTYHVNSVNKDNLNDGVNNYSDPDATIACTILVDGSPVSNETAPESGYADCSGNGLDSQSGT